VPQQLKPEVREKIIDAGLHAFAASGFRVTTMQEVATGAGISTGNTYRYFADKRALFEAVVPARFCRDLLRLLRQRIEALKGIDDVRSLSADAPYHLLSEELLRFCVEHRLRVVVVLTRAEGSPRARFGERVVGSLMRLATAHAASLGQPVRLTRAQRFALEQIYGGFIRAMAQILEQHEDEAAIRSAVEAYTSYHLAGLRGFFAGNGAAA